MASTNGRHGPYNNVAEIASLSPREFYFDGIFQDRLDPLLAMTYRGDGAAFAPPSDFRKTRADGKRPGYRDRHREGEGFAKDITGQPFASQEPRWTQGGGPSGPGLPDHMAYPESTARPGDPLASYVPPRQAPGAFALWANIPGVDRLMDLYRASPIGALFLGLAGIVVVNAMFFRSGRIGRTASATGAAIASPASGAKGVGEAAVDAVNDTVADAVKAVDSAVPGNG